MSLFKSYESVVYIITKLELGGAQKICLSLFHDLASLGTTTYLITSDEGVLVDKVKDLSNVFLLRTLKREIRFFSFLREIKTFFRMISILRTLKKQHPNLIVHTHSSKAGALGRLAAYCAGIKTRIHTVHGFAFNEHQSLPVWCVTYGIEWLCALITTHFVCVSSADIKIGTRSLPGFKKKHSLIRAAVDTQHFFVPAQQTTSFPEYAKPFVFGTISCFKPQKNLIDLLKAFDQVHSKNKLTRLEVIGDGIMRTEIEQWIAAHNLQNAITLHGWQQDVQPFLKTWHCFVMSSLWEGLPCVLVEARLSRLPVVSYDTGGIRDIIHHGINGFVHPQGSWKQLAHSMLALSIDELLHMTVRMYPDNFTDFDLKVMLAKHHQLYQSITPTGNTTSNI